MFTVDSMVNNQNVKINLLSGNYHILIDLKRFLLPYYYYALILVGYNIDIFIYVC